MEGDSFLRSAIVYLGAAVVAGTLTSRLRLGSVLGYLAAGVAIGPGALGLIESPAEVLRFAEFGVVLLLFLIGLELEPHRLWQLRRPIFGTGGAQVLACAAAFWALGLALGQRSGLSLVAGLGFAMSSTALAIQILRERNLLQIPAGQMSFAVLLFQDLAVIPMLALLPLLAPAGGGAAPAAASRGEAAVTALTAGAALLGVVVAGRFLLRPLFRVIAATGLRELFTAFALLLVLGIAFVMEKVGLSMALGTFLAGVLLADSEYRHELEVDIEPFKGLLVGLFFIAVGMSIDLAVLGRAPLAVAALVAALLAVKVALLHGLGRASGSPGPEAAIFALALSQGGEFAFVLFGLAARLRVIDAGEAALLNAAVALSMATTPVLFLLHDRLGVRRARAAAAEAGLKYAPENQKNPVILAGYGRVGQVVGRLLHARRIGVTILEQDPAQIEIVRRFGWKTFYGDVSRLDLLHAAGAADARLLVLAIDDMEKAEKTIQLAREHFPNLALLVRAESRLDAYRFVSLEVPVVRATWAPGLEMGREALRLLGTPAHEAHVIAQRFERYDRELLRKTAAFIGDEKALISISRQAREELARIMATDDQRRGELAGDGWS